MNPNPDMDLLVSKIIDEPTKEYSTNIKDAWTVVEWCMDYADGDLFIEYWQDGEWYICNENLWNRHQYKESLIVKARSDNVCYDDDKRPSFPLAICRYALKVGIRQKFIEQEVLLEHFGELESDE
jgi:hypothetical protein